MDEQRGLVASNSAAPGAPAGDPRVFLAAERTFLAWIRTGIALMGFGFILARFGIFLRQIQLMRESAATQKFAASLWLGVALVTIGVGVNIAATIRHIHFVRGLREGRSDFDRPSRLAIAVAIVLAAIGLMTAIYLVIVSPGAAPA
jgi:putative membrane protein